MTMRRLVLLLLVMLIESCASKINCESKTKPACIKVGGECQLIEDDCNGALLIGKKYCKKAKKCGCCTDCSEGTLRPCEALNGTCISQDDWCDGREVSDPTFCKWSDNCKCCFSDCDPIDYDLEICWWKGVEGKCSRIPIVHYKNVGRLPCVHSYGDCWIPECRSIGDRCKCNEAFCVEPDVSCPDGYEENSGCYKPVLKDGKWFKSIKCKCCKPTEPACHSKYDLCTKPDYCVEQGSSKCASGFGKVLEYCCKTSDLQYKNGSSGNMLSLNISFKCEDCDCCMSLDCRSNGTDCTGNGDFCIDPALNTSCPVGYIASYGCHKLNISSGKIVGNKTCICCKPDCGSECLSPFPITCNWVMPGPCPAGFCHYASGQSSPYGCNCCKDIYPTGCTSIGDQCNEPDDYCVEKDTGNCLTGFIKIPNACYSNPSVKQPHCDCCKSPGCIPIGDRCSGPRDCCIDEDQTCQTFYKSYPDCHKYNTTKGTWSTCKCCKPLFSERVEEKLLTGEFQFPGP